MLHLANADLTAECLDPVADRDRLGPRFCGGGFIWQIRTSASEPLLSGPEWPNPTPDPFNGQGFPESFRHKTLSGEPLTWRGERGLALGAGEIVQGKDATMLASPCVWSVTPDTDRLTFTTEQAAVGFHYRLTRTVQLAGRVVRSTSHVMNLGAEPLRTQWFAHPFFRLPASGLARALVPPGTALAWNPAFAVDGNRFVQTRVFRGAHDGHFDHVQLPTGEPLVARIEMPVVGTVLFRTSFVPSSCVVWGNDRTFSIEPYLDLDLPPGGTQEWFVEYAFGTAH